MKTRSQQREEKEQEQRMIAEFTHQFFDDASKAWLANKEKYGQNMYRYKREAFQEPVAVIVRRSKRLLEKKESS